jgi:hypothetical protein
MYASYSFVSLNNLLSLKTEDNVPDFFCILNVTEEKSWIRSRIRIN